VWEAGRIIFVLAIILWFLASYGPSLNQKTEAFESELITQKINPEAYDNQVTAFRLENSYIGIIGKTIEPVFRPLGYDWKISIALCIGEEPEEKTIIQRLEGETDPVTGRKRFNLATALSLLIFYALAMQCISTLAIVRRETKSWMYPILQLVVMTALAYLGALGVLMFRFGASLVLHE